MAIEVIEIDKVVAAIGALGLASFALVDATKVGRKGGLSNSGFVFIKTAVQQLLPDESLSDRSTKAAGRRTLLDVLHANWIAGMALGDQKAVAKSLIKLRLSPDTAGRFAAATGVSADVLTQVGIRMTDGNDLVPAEANVLGRFDLALTALLDEGYQRADQKYRNATRVIAMIVSVVIAVLGGWTLALPAAADYFGSRDMWLAFFCGILATPLAPISKDLASALQAGVKLAQSLRK